MENIKVPPPFPKKEKKIKTPIAIVLVIVAVLIVLLRLPKNENEQKFNGSADTSVRLVNTSIATTDGMILLPTGFDCFNDGDWRVGIHSLFRKGKVEFISTYLGRDSYEEGMTDQQQLKKALELSFGDKGYKKTRDGIYMSTGRYIEDGAMWYYYSVFVPEKTFKFSVRSQSQTKEFSDLSIFLLEQIRKNRKAAVIGLVTHDGKSCAFTVETTEN